MIDFKQLMLSPKYDFLRTHERLGKRIILLGLGGSHAYGTNNENSDIDFRSITLNSPSDLLGLTAFEQFEDDRTDTVIYSFNKMVKLLLECNPNTCEIRTHRTGDLDLLLKIRNGGFQKEDRTFTSEFYDILAHYESEFERAARETSLPDNPDTETVGAFVEYVNRKAVEGDY